MERPMTPVPIQPRRVVEGEIGVGAVVGIGRHARRTRARLSNGFDQRGTSWTLVELFMGWENRRARDGSSSDPPHTSIHCAGCSGGATQTAPTSESGQTTPSAGKLGPVV